jgi:hypothetical protein
MTLHKYYRNAMLIPAGLVIAFNVIYGIFDLINSKNIKSEWLTNDSVFMVSIMMVIVNCILIGSLSLTIYLNKYRTVRQHIVASIFSWFLLPGIWIGYIWSKHVNYLLLTHNGLDTESVFVISNTLPFVIGLIYTFIRFQLNKRLTE